MEQSHVLPKYAAEQPPRLEAALSELKSQDKQLCCQAPPPASSTPGSPEVHRNSSAKGNTFNLRGIYKPAQLIQLREGKLRELRNIASSRLLGAEVQEQLSESRTSVGTDLGRRCEWVVLAHPSRSSWPAPAFPACPWGRASW